MRETNEREKLRGGQEKIQNIDSTFFKNMREKNEREKQPQHITKRSIKNKHMVASYVSQCVDDNGTEPKPTLTKDPAAFKKHHPYFCFNGKFCTPPIASQLSGGKLYSLHTK
jgi:hypothetical protein|tara:strand:- start:393 stop:728 length:336 start_codon:yes stop_codon:yes gene_type:complete